MTFYFEHVLEWRRFEETYLTTLHSSSSTHALTDAHTAWGLAVAELWGPGTGGNPGIRSLVSNRVNTSRYFTYELAGPRGRKSGLLETVLVTAGSDVSQEMIPAISLVLVLQGLAQAGRHHGRMYMPAPAIDQWTNGVLNASAITQALASAKAALLAIYNAGLEPAIVNQQTGQYTGVTDVAAWNRGFFLRSRDKSFHYGKTTLHVFP